jgi:hypothetical protein
MHRAFVQAFYLHGLRTKSLEDGPDLPGRLLQPTYMDALPSGQSLRFDLVYHCRVLLITAAKKK